MKYFFKNYKKYLTTINCLKQIYYKMSQSIECECPICMDSIDIKKNCVTTDCGHCFHASCLMTSVAHNGFGCPYCRAVMAEVPKEEEEEDDYFDEEEDDEMFSEYSLRGFRFFFNNLNEEENDNEDNLEEDEDNEEEEEEEEEEGPPKPSIDFITQKLLEQGITMEKLIKSCLIDHDEYEEEIEFEMVSREVFGKLRTIISNFTPALPPALEVIPPLVDIC